MKYDLLVVGGGPAGLTAAIHARARDKSVLVISNEPTASPLCRAPEMANYPGLPGVTGVELVRRLLAQARDMGAEFKTGRALSVLPMGRSVMVSVENDAVEGSAVILAPGVSRAAPLKGELELLGRGVSYCATCDGMLYRNKPIVCAGDAPNFAEEVEFLRSIGCQATEAKLAGLEILGTDRVTGVRDAKGEEIPCDGVFLLRASIAPAQLVPGLDLEDGYIKVDGRMSAGLPGVFAAGDCTGQPLQLAKAVGQGQIAAHFAIEGMA
jgi:thioredoxin reductase (NADPH)